MGMAEPGIFQSMAVGPKKSVMTCWRHEMGRGDCLTKTQVPAKSRDDV